MNLKSKNILICGHKSFAAQELVDKLKQGGHRVTCFTRGAFGRSGYIITGPVDGIHQNPFLTECYDTVINYILLKDESIQRNEDYIDSLVKFCISHSVVHLIHISSISVYKTSVREVNETSAIEDKPNRKGSYGSLKVATEQRIIDNLPPSIKLTLIRPGFILGKGLVNPIVGIGAKLPWNSLLTLGSKKCQLPVISRDLVNKAICKIVDEPPNENREVLLLADNNSPARNEYLQICCRKLGCGTKVSNCPVPLWLMAGIGVEIIARIIGQSKLKPYQKISSVCKRYHFNSSRTEQRLNTKLSFDWVSELKQSMYDQHLNFELPPKLEQSTKLSASRITFIGYGRIVKQKHLPALKSLGFSGEIYAYDLRAQMDSSGQQVLDITTQVPEPADLFVLATPGPAHVEAIEKLRHVDKPILIEKPLCYSLSELIELTSFAKSKKAPILVCHNYRYKINVLEMLSILSQFNPGNLYNVNIHFESPPVSWDGAAWLRKERQARTLLLDYSLHFLDIAFMFSKQEAKLLSLRHKLNDHGQTCLIEGRSLTENYSVNFLLRQGFGPRRANILFNFQNYSIKLSYFPDTCTLYMSNDNPFLYAKEMISSFRATFQKIFDKIAQRDSDFSHAKVFSLFSNINNATNSPINIKNLSAFYKTIFQIEQEVYKS